MPSAKPRERRFILTGSANLLLLKSISETLAGRATYHTLYPFTPSEYQGRKNLTGLLIFLKNLSWGKEFPEIKETNNAPSLSQLLYRGFSPTRFFIKYSRGNFYLVGRLHKNLPRKGLKRPITHNLLTDFRNVMQLLALRTASIIDQTGISRDTGISQPTVHRYINLPEASNLFVRLRPFTKLKLKASLNHPKDTLSTRD